MVDKIPEKVRLAVRNTWGVENDLEELISVEELEDDWVVWRAGDEGMIGSPRLIVPKNGKNSFEIPSGYAANDTSGVSWKYEIQIHACGHPRQQPAKSLATHAGISAIEAFRALKNPPLVLGVFHIDEPLVLMRELEPFDVTVKLTRPDENGGDRTESVRSQQIVMSGLTEARQVTARSREEDNEKKLY